MAMSRYNRENPFMYLLEQKESQLLNVSENLIKIDIVSWIITIMTIICIISSLLMNGIDSLTNIVLVLMEIFIMLMFTYMVRGSVKSIHSSDVNEMIFGDQYKDINVNNEKLLAYINEYNVSIGKVESIGEMLKILNVMNTTVMSIFLVRILSYVML